MASYNSILPLPKVPLNTINLPPTYHIIYCVISYCQNKSTVLLNGEDMIKSTNNVLKQLLINHTFNRSICLKIMLMKK